MHIDSFYAGNLQLGEGILVEKARGYVWWVDILGKFVYRANLDGNQQQQWQTPDLVGFVLPKPNSEHYWLGLKSGPHTALLRAGQVPELDQLSRVDAALATVRVNDGSVSPDGKLYVTTMDMDGKKPLGHLLCYDQQGQETALATNFIIANGPAVQPDKPVVYVVESEGHEGRRKGVYRLDLQHDTPTETYLIDWPHDGSPDGVSMDELGTLWVGTFGGHTIRQFTTAGKPLRTIDLPALNVTKVARHENRLYVTSATDGVSDEQRRQYPLTGHVLVIDDID